MLIANAAKAQDMVFDHIGYSEGLSNSTIQAIIQDMRGFMWIGTRDGLNLYDGRQVTVFRNVPGQLNSLSDNYITCLYTDHENNLWVGTSNGLNQYNSRLRTFTAYVGKERSNIALHGNRVNCIFEDAQKRLWIGTNAGLNLMDQKEGTFKLMHTAGAVNCIYQDQKNNLWLGTQGGLINYTANGKPLFNTAIIRIQQDKAEDLWLATENKGLIRYDLRNGQSTIYRHNDADPNSLGSDLVLALLADKKGQILAGTINGGLNIFDAKTNGFKKYTYRAGFEDGLSQRTISALFEDKQGNYWIGTHRGGVNIFSPKARKFKVYRQQPSGKGLSYNDVKCFEQDHSGRIWIGTDGGGLNLFDKAHNTFKVYNYKVNEGGSLGSDAVLDLTEDKQNRLWIATWGGGLNLFHPQSNTFTRFMNIPGDSTSLSSNFVQKVYQDTEGKLWVGTYFGGLNIFNPLTGKFSRITRGTGNSVLSGNNIVSINEDAYKNLWIGTDDGGLNRYDRNSAAFKHYFAREPRMPDVRVIFSDSRKRLWIGQAGLYVYDKNADTFRVVTKKAGLDHIFIKGITEDNYGHLWISTSNGLIRFKPDTGDATTYNTADGLQAMEFEVNAFMKARDGEMYFGGINGFNTFYPDKIKANTYLPAVYITGFQIFNKEVFIGPGTPLKQDVSITQTIRLNYEQSSISFTFAALNYITPQNNRYAYRLTGIDKNYVYTQANKAVYTNLDPGTYVFRVKAANNDGLWANKGASITIIITPPWWQTWWFKLFALIFAGGAVYAYLRYRHQQQLKTLEAQKKEEIHQTQLQFFTNISHEFRTPLSLILGPVENIINNYRQQQSADLAQAHGTIYRNAKRLMHLVSELMDFRKAESGALQLKVTGGNISLFLQEIAGEFAAWAQQKGITFKVEANSPEQAVLFDRQVLEKILLNLINNALKYTNNGGEVSVTLLFDLDRFTPRFAHELKVDNNYAGKKYIYIVVADTGIGITAESMPNLFQRYYRITSAHLGSGIGLAFVKTLTLLHKGYIKVYSERNKGTDIIIALPISEHDYSANERWKGNNDAAANLFSNDDYYEYTEENAIELTNDHTGKHHLKNILLVDDNVELRNFLQDSLQKHFRITVANNGREGLAKAEAQTPDMIISDVMMPDMDGIEFCRQIKQDQRTMHIPFIMLTARNALEAQLEGIGSGADSYLPKPVSINLLLLTINNIFNRQSSLKNRYTEDYAIEARDAARTEKDRQFVNDLIRIIESRLADPLLDVQYLCDALNMSRTKLYELIKQLTGQSIIEFIRTVRLNKARYILTHEEISIAEVILRVGIQTQAYFTKAFKKEFGKTPSQYLQELNKKD
ncbi:response regulator [Mucilaginibacter sp. UR6-1]|uniref:hybrid sensor histidine kinase/response regulator transcription factor n=1 Tax=Mucilaginibacter sp. UR6-1 TaxID=1435643 RepID=UPI001E659FD9|nr:two-component regulator propeller domain-containing protein [Mucilaginibacter sp. UR6-1]MCC8410673.1 response regulator [Mucilaginibacter sp. UR6-1]